MGLRVVAHRQIRFAPLERFLDEDGEFGDLSGAFQLFIGDPASPQARGIPQGCAAEGSAEKFSFSAGAYSSYGQWRERLAELAGYPLAGPDMARASRSQGAWLCDAGPFHELIDFSDCEGSIGPDASAKLAADFKAYASRAETFAGVGSHFAETYRQFAQAFEMAADGGAVLFR